MATQGSPGMSLHDSGASSSKRPADRKTPAQPQQAKRQATATAPRVQPKVVDGAYTTNRKGSALCTSFNNGTCAYNKSSFYCPKDSERRHLCSKCLSDRHGAHECKVTSSPASASGKKGFQHGNGFQKRK